MQPFFGAGLFDNPLIVAAILIAGALIQWLSHRREKQNARREAELEESPPQAGNLEEELRRLLGIPSEEPPPVYREERATPPPVPAWETEEAEGPRRPSLVQTLRAPPPIVENRPVIREPRRAERPLVLRTTDPTTTRRRRARSHAHLWKSKESVRQAFIASLVFGPPKSLEQ